VPIYKKRDRHIAAVCQLHTTSYKILSNSLLSRLTPYAEEIIADHQWVFRRNRSTTDHIFDICQIPEKMGIQ
jgi:hypothetical protein